MKGITLYSVLGHMAVLILFACETSYRPEITGTDVSCAAETTEEEGRWRFSAWVEDGNGADNVQGVQVDLVDFAGSTVDTVTLQRDGSNYWSNTETESELGIACEALTDYLYVFRARDLEGEEATSNLYPQSSRELMNAANAIRDDGPLEQH